jgi:hypothetical protein
MTVVGTLKRIEAPITIALTWVLVTTHLFVPDAIEVDVSRVTHGFSPSARVDCIRRIGRPEEALFDCSADALAKAAIARNYGGLRPRSRRTIREAFLGCARQEHFGEVPHMRTLLVLIALFCLESQVQGGVIWRLRLHARAKGVAAAILTPTAVTQIFVIIRVRERIRHVALLV